MPKLCCGENGAPGVAGRVQVDAWPRERVCADVAEGIGVVGRGDEEHVALGDFVDA